MVYKKYLINFVKKNLTFEGVMGNEFNSLFNNIKDLVINSRNKDI